MTISFDPRVSFHPMEDFAPTDICCICREPLNKEVVAHDRKGALHPIHKNCIKGWVLKGDPICPTCRTPINLDSLLSMKDRLTRITLIAERKLRDPLMQIVLGILVEEAPSTLTLGIGAAMLATGLLRGGIREAFFTNLTLNCGINIARIINRLVFGPTFNPIFW